MIATALLLLALPAASAGIVHPHRHAKPRHHHGPVVVPIDIGVGPIAMLPSPPAFADQPVFTGIEISLAAIIDKELIQEHSDQIPPGLRNAARGINEVRYRPWFVALVPERLIISPQISGLAKTGMYGAIWRPFGLGVSLIDKPVNVSVNANVDVAYIFIHSAVLGGGTAANNSITHFLRPGVNLSLVAELPLSESFLVSTGWSSDLFVPQPYGRPPWEFSPFADSLWHLGGPFVMLHFRIPYTVNL